MLRNSFYVSVRLCPYTYLSFVFFLFLVPLLLLPFAWSTIVHPFFLERRSQLLCVFVIVQELARTACFSIDLDKIDLQRSD